MLGVLAVSTVCLPAPMTGCSKRLPERIGGSMASECTTATPAHTDLVVAHSITSDCDADNDVYSSHHYTKTPEEAVRDVLRAGSLHSAAY